jgi:hypothetical protein
MPKSNTFYQLDPVDAPDPDTNGARQILGGLSKESIYRLAKRGEIDGYMLCGKRFWLLASLRSYRERQKAKGLQFDAPPVTGKRKPGRPPKPKQEPSTANAAE